MSKASDWESDRIGAEPKSDPAPWTMQRSNGPAVPGETLLDHVRGPLASSIGLRPALAADEPFLFRVFASIREDEVQLVAWNDDQKAAFLTMQYSAQRSSYLHNFAGSGYDVISIGDRPVGRLFVHRSTDFIRLVDLGLLREYRNRGIGGALLTALQDEAALAGKPVRLHVGSFNRALALYERLGFRPVGETGIHVEMEWAPRIPIS